MSTRHRRRRTLLVVSLLMSLGFGTRLLQAQVFGIASSEIRPFVIGFTPVIGRNGTVGGVMINSAGVVRRANAREAARLDRMRRAARTIGSVSEAFDRDVPRRMVSLRRLAALLAEHVERGAPLPLEAQFLGGLQRIEYVFVFPDQQDVVLAGPAGGLLLGKEAMQSRGGAAPVLRLDDLLAALQAVSNSEAVSSISCSIDPTSEGLLRLQQLLGRRDLVLSEGLLSTMTAALGEQQVTISGISPDTHFARILVGADVQMKRLAMGLDRSASGLPSYLDLLRDERARVRDVQAPRWWLALEDASVSRSPDGLAWKLNDMQPRVLTEDAYLTAAGRLIDAAHANPLNAQWAEAMSASYDELAREYAVFAQLRGCIDLSIVAALIAAEELDVRAGCDLEFLRNPRSIRGPRYNVPKTIDSQATLVRARRGWMVSLSGGVEIDLWSVLHVTREDPGLERQRRSAAPRPLRSFWWQQETDAAPVPAADAGIGVGRR